MKPSKAITVLNGMVDFYRHQCTCYIVVQNITIKYRLAVINTLLDNFDPWLKPLMGGLLAETAGASHPCCAPAVRLLHWTSEAGLHSRDSPAMVRRAPWTVRSLR